MTSSQLYLRLLRHVRPYWRVFAISILGMMGAAVTEALLPVLFKTVLDGTFIHKDEAVIRLIPAYILLIFFFRGMTTFIATYTISWVGNKVVMDLRNAMFERLLSLPTRFYDDHPTGGLISKLTFDVTQVTAAATTVVTIGIRDSLMIVGLLGWLFYLNWKLTLLSLIMAPVIVYFMRIISRRLRATSRNSQQAMGDITQVIEESITAHKVVKLFGGQGYESRRFSSQANWVRRHAMKQTAAAAANMPIVQMIAGIALAGIVYLATEQARSDATTVGGFLSFIAAMLMLTSPLKRLASVSEHLQRGLAAAESVFALLDTPGEKDAGRLSIARASGHLKFEQVSFSYRDDGKLTLHNLSLDIPAGQTLALVGSSGGGKTTLINLVPRFYSPCSGRVTLDGHDLETLTLSSLRANIALVSQEVVLFNDTVAANIAYGQERAVPEQEILAAAQAAHALEFIREMPQGMQTLVGEKGVRLSGGQRQRIAIARAILKNAPILILDEATSALDSESERHVQAALETLMQGRTTLIIAHRLSTIEKADRIIVLHRGEIAESGTHQELLSAGGMYAQLQHNQFMRGQPPESPR